MSFRRLSKLRLSVYKIDVQNENDECLYLKEGLKLHKLACSKHGEKANFYFNRAIVKLYDMCLEKNLNPDKYKEILIIKGNCYLDHAQNVLLSFKLYKDIKLKIINKKESDLQAVCLLQCAILTYRKTLSNSVVSDEIELDETASLNCALALCILAEKHSSDKAISLLERAINLYELAVSKANNNIKLLQKLADTYIRMGRALINSNKILEGNKYFLKALETFTKACSISNANDGDDLHKLLYNWAIGYYSIAEMTQTFNEKMRLFNASIDRLEFIVHFYKDCSAFCTLGDVFFEKAKLLHNNQDGNKAISHLRDAIDKGYKQAIKIKKNKISAIIGLANANFYMGKILLEQNNKEASNYIEKSVRYYSIALASSSGIESITSIHKLIYNYACACALCQRESSVQRLLILLLDLEWITIRKIFLNEYFSIYRNTCWFQNLYLKYM